MWVPHFKKIAKGYCKLVMLLSDIHVAVSGGGTFYTGGDTLH